MKICDRCESKENVRSTPWFDRKELCTKCVEEFRDIAEKWLKNELKLCRCKPKLVFTEVKERKVPEGAWSIDIKGGKKNE